ncbi:MAG: four helix bundle protein [Chitinophagaceae bacterium]|nr:four helix bundle protein [Chitinophagaceae bacterium]
MLKSAHKTLDVYKLSLALVKMIYETTRRFPKEEQYLLVIQLRRAAISVCSNIAEGSSRISGNEKKRFYEIARSSVAEIDTQIEIAINLNFLDFREIKPLEENIESIFRMLSKMIRNLS